MRPEAIEAYASAAARVGNPSSLHAPGRAARSLVEDAREAIAAALGAHPTEVVFTSGATEADNLAIKGWFHAGGRVLLTTAIEHHAALDPARWLDEQGAAVTMLDLHRDGRVDLVAARDAIWAAGPGALVSVHAVNNEIGTVQPIAELADVAASAGASVHVDAAQAPGHLSVDFDALGVTTLAVSGHKVGGPMGVGALLVRRDARLTPLAHGGGQQRFRSGTLDAPGIAAFAAALTASVAALETETSRLRVLRERLISGVSAAIPEARVSGPSGEGAAPHIVHWVLPGADAEAVLFGLDQEGIAASSGSACTAGVVDASHVLLALGASPAEAAQTLRLSLGWTTTDEDVEAVLAALPGVVERARAAAGWAPRTLDG